MKAYHEVCIDIIKMLEEIEESLQDISNDIQPLEKPPESAQEKQEESWLERHFDFMKKA